MFRTQDELVQTRTTLIHRLKDWRDQSSWQDFFDTYWKLIYTLAIRSHLTETEAQEVVQETMISIARHMPTFHYDRRLGSFKQWLLNLTRWRIVDQLRKRRKFVSFHSDTAIDARTAEEVVGRTSRELEAIWNAEWENNLLEAAFSKVRRRLDPQKYQIFDFYVNKGWPPDRVAETFGIAVGQVYLAKHRVTEMVKAEVDRLRDETI